jgi:decaprenylphospho-beta-D-erythro-pentofuranosid-2-ulose 2-reductase
MARVLIIGASSAIAAEVARRCATRGDRLFLIARDPQKLRALEAELGGCVVGTLAADLTSTSRSAALIAKAVRALGELDLTIVAHGLLGDQRATELHYSAAEEVLQTNLLSVIALLIPIANVLEAQGQGTVAVLTSVAGDRGRPRNYTYGAAKGALNLYLQGLRSRLHGRGVKVFAIRLGPVDTPMTAGHRKTLLFGKPGPIADRLLHLLEGRRQDLYLPSFWAPIMAVVRNLPEGVFQRLGFLSKR